MVVPNKEHQSLTVKLLRLADFLCLNMTGWSFIVYTVLRHTDLPLTELEENLLFQDVRVMKILLTVLHYDSFDIILTLLTPCIGIVVIYWHCLQLTKLYANALYVF